MGHQAKVKFERRMQRASGSAPKSAPAKATAKRNRRSIFGESRDIVLKFKSNIGYWAGQSQSEIENKRKRRNERRTKRVA